MFTVREMSGDTIEEMLMPPFRKVLFSDSPAVVTVSTFLRAAWTAAVPEDETSSPESVGKWMSTHSRKPKEERDRIPQNPDSQTIHTPWRDSTYHQWNHVFYDTMNFLQEAAMGVGHLHAPSHDVFGLSYPSTEFQHDERIWNHNVLLIPTYLAPGTTVKMFNVKKEDGTRKDLLGQFDQSNESKSEIWFLASGNKVHFVVEKDGENEVQEKEEGLAAVMVVGVLCSEDHYGEGQVEGEGESEGEDEDES